MVKNTFFLWGAIKTYVQQQTAKKISQQTGNIFFITPVPCLSNTLSNIFIVWTSSVFGRGLKILGQYSGKGIVFGISYVFRRWEGANCLCVSEQDIWNNNTAVFAFQRHPFHMFLLKQDTSRLWKMWESTKKAFKEWNWCQTQGHAGKDDEGNGDYAFVT